MSEWYETDPEHIDIDFNDKEFNILVSDNDSGNVYLTIPFGILKCMYDEMMQEDEGQGSLELL